MQGRILGGECRHAILLLRLDTQGLYVPILLALEHLSFFSQIDNLLRNTVVVVDNMRAQRRVPNPRKLQQSEDLEMKIKVLEANLAQMQKDLSAAERQRRTAEVERDELAEEARWTQGADLGGSESA